MQVDVVVAIIGVLSVIITGTFAFIAGKNADKNTYITEQRQNWRDYIRKWVENITCTIEKYNDCIEIDSKEKLKRSINNQINAVITRLNPNRDQKIINYLVNGMIKKISK